MKALMRFLLLVTATLLVVAAPAAAQGFGYVKAGEFGAAGSGAGEFSAPKQVAVESSTGRIFVVDSGNSRIQVFEPGGGSATYLTAITGPLDRPYGLAIDQTTGNVYVSDVGTSHIYRFVSDGAPVPTYTVDPTFASPPSGGTEDGRVGSYRAALAVDPADGSLLVADSGNKRISRFDATGAFVSSFSGFVDPIAIAVSADSKVFVIDADGDVTNGATSRVWRFAADGSFEDTLPGAENSGAVAVDPHTGYVLVADKVAGFNGPRILSYDGLTRVGDVPFPAADTSGTVRGLAVDGGASGHVYAVGDRVFDFYGSVGVQVLETVAAPDAVVQAPTSVTTVSALLHGTVDPNGSQTSWHFEISDDEGTTWTPNGAIQDAGDGTDPVAVQVEAAELQSNHAYLVRLIATAPAIGVTATSATESFTTGVAAPNVKTGLPNPATATGVLVGGTVDPNGSPTTYWVEFGATATYGTSLPASQDADAGSGNSPGLVAQRLTGLQPGTTYHYRLVARNDGGQTVGDDETVTTAPTAEDPKDARHFELVSPPDKNNRDVGSRMSTIRSSVDGDRVAFASNNPFPGAAGNGMGNDYLARRGASGWITSDLTPPQDPNRGAPLTGARYARFTADLTAGVLRATPPALAPHALPDASNLYRRDFDGPAGQYTTVTPLVVEDVGAAGVNYVAADSDLRHVFFEATQGLGLTPDAPDDGLNQSYVYGPEGLRFVGNLPDGTVSSEGIFVGRGFFYNNGALNAVSADGSSAVVTANVIGLTPSHVYLWREDGPMLDISRSRLSVPEPSRNMLFLIAARDHSRVFFRAGERLVEDSTATPDAPGLFMWTREGDTVTDLTAGDPLGGGVVDVLGAADDGSRVYFVATGKLAAGATLGDQNLYAWSDEAGIRFITSIETNSTNIEWSPITDLKTSRVSADGSGLLFQSSRQLTAYDNHGTQQLYLYDADRDGLECVSCRPDGQPPTGDTSLTGNSAAIPPPGGNLSNVLSDDGKHVFFDTAEDLVPGDVNGVTDAYEWVDGRVRLISSGKGTAPARFGAATPDGRQVFITTRERLSGWDVDDYADLYAARTGDRIPEPEPEVPAAPCVDACQGDPPAPPSLRGPGSDTSSGSGNVTPAAAKLVVAKSKTIRGTAGALRLRVSSAGVVSATGAGIASVRRTVASGRSLDVRLGLSAAAKRKLMAKGSLVVRVAVKFAPRSGRATTAAVRVTYKRPARAGGTKGGR
jgi:hypothetical protein